MHILCACRVRNGVNLHAGGGVLGSGGVPDHRGCARGRYEIALASVQHGEGKKVEKPRPVSALAGRISSTW